MPMGQQQQQQQQQMGRQGMGGMGPRPRALAKMPLPGPPGSGAPGQALQPRPGLMPQGPPPGMLYPQAQPFAMGSQFSGLTPKGKRGQKPKKEKGAGTEKGKGGRKPKAAKEVCAPVRPPFYLSACGINCACSAGPWDNMLCCSRLFSPSEGGWRSCGSSPV